MEIRETSEAEEPLRPGARLKIDRQSGWLAPWLRTPSPHRNFRSWREEGRRGWLILGAVFLQLLLIGGVAQWLSLEAGRGFTGAGTSPLPVLFTPFGGGLLAFLIAAFLVHAFLPWKARLPFFLILSLAAPILVLGWIDGTLLVVFGLALVGICHLPLPHGLRVALVLAAGGLLAALRAGVIPSAIGSAVLPILASLFMFRMIIYLYDLRHEKKPAGACQRLSYFFLAPNVCFPLFPVVDYATFLRTYYDGRELAIYQKGVRWMSRGVVQLVLYRLLYQHLSPSPADVEDLLGVVVFVISSYLLYLRISGQFHLIIGLLCLFGFNLPETHHRYLLASGFSDYWRRINIYWKDFMMKLVFYPAYLRFKGLGHLVAIALGTALVFLATWLLHGYQWFWLRGTFHFSLVDGLFWSFFALLVIINALREATRTPNRTGKHSPDGRFDLSGAIRRSLQTGAMFVLVCLLFAFWQSHSVGQFTALMAQAGNVDPEQLFLLVGLTLLALTAGVLVPWIRHRWRSLRKNLSAPPSLPWWPATATVLPILLVLVAGSDAFRDRLERPAADVLASIRADTLNARDRRTLERGYYEELLQRESFGSPLWEVRLEQRPDWKPMTGSGMSRPTGDLLHHELIPDQELEIDGVLWRTNRWAMHDHDHYARRKPPGVYRIALLSASYGAGHGMPIEQTFENLVEARLNQSANLTADRIEILNFSVPGYTLVEFVAFLETRIAPFEADAFYLVTHSKEGPRTLGTLARRIREKVPLVYPFLESIPERAGLPENPTDQEMRRISRYRDEVEDWGYRRMVEFCARHGMKPVWIHLPATDEIIDADALDSQEQRAIAAGFETITLEGVYGNGDPSEIWLAPHDRHPNAEGHRRIADRLIVELFERTDQLELPVRGEGDGGAPLPE